MKKLTCIIGLGLVLALGALNPFASSASASEPFDYGAMLKTYTVKEAWRLPRPPIKEDRSWLNPARAALKS